jgi:hypothetical protein
MLIFRNLYCKKISLINKKNKLKKTKKLKSFCIFAVVVVMTFVGCDKSENFLNQVTVKNQ